MTYLDALRLNVRDRPKDYLACITMDDILPLAQEFVARSNMPGDNVAFRANQIAHGLAYFFGRQVVIL